MKFESCYARFTLVFIISVHRFRFLVDDGIFQSHTNFPLEKKSLATKPKIIVLLQGLRMPPVNTGKRTFPENDIH
jgi:hypothetical protein